MDKEFVPYEQALALKELGFDEPHFKSYVGISNNGDIKDCTYVLCNGKLNNDDVSAPTFSQAFRWFREKYGLLSYVDKCLTDTFRYNLDLNGSMIGLSGHKTHEEAELACLIKLIQIVKEKKNG